MTIEELKEHCIRHIAGFERSREIMPVTPNDYRHYEEHKMVLQLIEALEQQPCEDCISRKATVERLCKVADFMNEKREGLGSPYIMSALFIQDNKDEFPSVTPKEKTGHWIRQTDDYHDYYECEHCGIAVGLDDIKNYCPNCGAKMD